MKSEAQFEVTLSGFEQLKDKTAKRFKKNIKKTLKELGLKGQMLTVHLCDDKEIKALNKKFRKKNKATDVLSFEPGDVALPVLGDIVISVETAKLQAKEYGHGLLEELSVLFVHGLLHLLGYDHEKSEEDETRQAEAEMHILSMIDLPVKIALVAR